MLHRRRGVSVKQTYLEIVLALFCGLRTGEIRGFMFSDADQKASTISIKRQVTSDHIVYYEDDRLIVKRAGKSTKAPKSNSGIRTLRVHKIVFELLTERLHDIERQKEKSGYATRALCQKAKELTITQLNNHQLFIITLFHLLEKGNYISLRGMT